MGTTASPLLKERSEACSSQAISAFAATGIPSVAKDAAGTMLALRCPDLWMGSICRGDGLDLIDIQDSPFCLEMAAVPNDGATLHFLANQLSFPALTGNDDPQRITGSVSRCSYPWSQRLEAPVARRLRPKQPSE